MNEINNDEKGENCCNCIQDKDEKCLVNGEWISNCEDCDFYIPLKLTIIEKFKIIYYKYR